MTHDPYAVHPRKRLTDKQRLQMFIRARGLCCICGEKIDGVREAWDEHVNPLWRDGDNALDNRAPAHERCARGKTAKEATERAKSRRGAEKHFGAHRPRRPMPGSRHHPSRLRKRMDGTVTRWP